MQNSLSLERKLQLPDNYHSDLNQPVVRQHFTPAGKVTDVFVPMYDGQKYLGVLAIGINQVQHYHQRRNQRHVGPLQNDLEPFQ